MAFVDNNPLTEGLRGAIGDKLIFRKHGNRTVVYRKPNRDYTVKTAEHKQTTNRFRLAVDYANKVLLNPLDKLEYELIAKHKGKPHAHNAAVSDYLSETKLQSIDTHNYAGQSGIVIDIILDDNYKGKKMLISITGVDGTILEQGEARFLFGDTAWRYVTTKSIESGKAGKIIIEVTDRPGRTARLEYR